MQLGGKQFWTSVPESPSYRDRDIWSDHRREAWRYDILNLKDKFVGNLDGVESGSFEFNVNKTIRSDGSITWVSAPGAESPEWTQLRIQPWYLILNADGAVLSETPLGVFIPSFPSRSLSATESIIEVGLHDKLLILDQDKTQEAYTAHSGTMVTTLIRSLLLEAGQTALSMDESSEIIRTNMTWDAGTSWLRITNDVLEAAGYFSLSVDGFGTYQARKYVPPSQRGVERAFIDNDESIYSDEIGHDEDIFSVPNRVIAVSTADGENEAMVAVAEDNSGGRFSIPFRDRVIAETEEGVEATSQNVLNQYARRRLSEMQQVTSSYEISHAYVPLDLNDLVRLHNEPHGVDVYGVVQSFTISTETGANQQTRIREVGI